MGENGNRELEEIRKHPTHDVAFASGFQKIEDPPTSIDCLTVEKLFDEPEEEWCYTLTYRQERYGYQ